MWLVYLTPCRVEILAAILAVREYASQHMRKTAILIRLQATEGASFNLQVSSIMVMVIFNGSVISYIT